MDTLRGNFGSADYDAVQDDYDGFEDEVGGDLPPAAIGNDERRMQVRAYNHWAGQLDDRSFPSIEDLEPEDLQDFGPFSVLLDFTAGIEDPAIQYLGKELAGECGTEAAISQLSDVPSRSLLSRITDHYMQILANQAPIGFEAEFVNQRNATIMYRGILLPYSSDGETIDFIYGVINWKEMADQATTDELLLEIDQALGLDASVGPDDAADRSADPVTDWADGPGTDVLDLGAAEEIHNAASLDQSAGDDSLFPLPAFGQDVWDAEDAEGSEEDDYSDEDHGDEEEDAAVVARLSSLIQPRSGIPATIDSGSENDDWDGGDWDGSDSSIRGNPVSPLAQKPSGLLRKSTVDLAAEAASQPLGPVESESGLYDCLAEARELAHTARTSEDRTRATLYEAVGRAYDVSLAANDSPDEFAEILSECGLVQQDRAPMTPIVKLVFGTDYDKTRLTEYASVLSHAQRVGIERGALSGFLTNAEGGLKGVVQAERRLRKEESGKQVAPLDAPKPSIAKKLRQIDGQPLDSIDPHGAEFGVVMIRRLTTGEIVVLGEVSDDIALVEKVARKLIK